MLSAASSPQRPQLTRRQHFFPRATIKRFVGPDLKVELHDLPRDRRFRATPNDRRFYRERVWNERAEAIYSNTEHQFQLLAGRLASGEQTHLNEIDHVLVTETYALWRARYQLAMEPIGDSPVYGVQAVVYTPDEQRMLEAKHIGFLHDGCIPGRQVAGCMTQIWIDQITESLPNETWGVLRALDGEFLAPDTFSGARLLTVSPTVLLAMGSDDVVLARTDVAFINHVALQQAKTFVFARRLDACPGLNLTSEWGSRQHGPGAPR